MEPGLQLPEIDRNPGVNTPPPEIIDGILGHLNDEDQEDAERDQEIEKIKREIEDIEKKPPTVH